MVTAAAPIIAELGPVAIAAAATASVAAVAALKTIKSFFSGNDLASRTNRTTQSYQVIYSDIANKPIGEMTGEELGVVSEHLLRLSIEIGAKLAALRAEFLSTTFSSTEAANVAYQALSTNEARMYVTLAQQAQVTAHYDAEIARLMAVSVPVPSTTISTPDTTAPPATPPAEGVPLTSPEELGVTGYLTTPISESAWISGAQTAGIPGALTATGVAAALVAVAENLGCGLQRGKYACQDTGFASTMARILPSIAPLGMIAFLNNPTIAQQFTDPLTKVFLDQFVMMPEVQKPITPDEAPSVVRAIFSRAMGLGIGAHLAAEVAESSTTLKYMGLNYIAAFLCDMAGFSKIAAATMGVVESQALGLPMRYYVNEHVRTELPRMGDLLRMAEHYELTEGEFHQLAAYNNFSDALIAKYWHIAHRPAGYFMLRRMAASGLWDEPYYTGALKDCGFDLDTVDHAMDMLYSEAHADLKVIGVGPAMTRFKEGLDNEESLKTNLQTLGITQELIPKYVFAAKLAEDYDEFTDYKAAWQDSVRKGLSTPDDYEAALVARGLDPARAELIAARERIRLYPTLKKTAVS